MPSDLKPRRPFRELTTLRDEMDNLWRRFLEEWPSTELFGREWAPAFDVLETKENIVVKAEIPGMEAKDIDISLVGDTLTVKGEKRQETEEKNENFHRVERNYGAFSRSIRLPGDVQSDKIKANCKNGVLKITLPKSEETKKREIKIRVG
jgi:HSP20 family protein